MGEQAALTDKLVELNGGSTVINVAPSPEGQPQKRQGRWPRAAQVCVCWGTVVHHCSTSSNSNSSFMRKLPTFQERPCQTFVTKQHFMRHAQTHRPCCRLSCVTPSCVNMAAA